MKKIFALILALSFVFAVGLTSTMISDMLPFVLMMDISSKTFAKNGGILTILT